jgi:hypothetical protein
MERDIVRMNVLQHLIAKSHIHGLCVEGHLQAVMIMPCHPARNPWGQFVISLRADFQCGYLSDARQDGL